MLVGPGMVGDRGYPYKRLCHALLIFLPLSFLPCFHLSLLSFLLSFLNLVPLGNRSLLLATISISQAVAHPSIGSRTGAQIEQHSGIFQRAEPLAWI